jgi:hypothetical protein
MVVSVVEFQHQRPASDPILFSQQNTVTEELTYDLRIGAGQSAVRWYFAAAAIAVEPPSSAKKYQPAVGFISGTHCCLVQ